MIFFEWMNKRESFSGHLQVSHLCPTTAIIGSSSMHLNIDSIFERVAGAVIPIHSWKIVTNLLLLILYFSQFLFLFTEIISRKQ